MTLSDWTKTMIITIYKETGEKQEDQIYRSTSLLNVTRKVFGKNESDGKGPLFHRTRIIPNNVKMCSYLFQYQISRTLQNKSTEKMEEEEKPSEKLNEQVEEKKMSLVQRYKTMLKEYWYVLIPVHVATSLVWFGAFYYVAKSGIDIVPYLEAVGFSEAILQPLKNSSLGYLAVASAMYKLATPARYMVTVGGTTFAVKYLTKHDYIKPMKDIKTMIQQRRKRS